MSSPGDLTKPPSPPPPATSQPPTELAWSWWLLLQGPGLCSWVRGVWEGRRDGLGACSQGCPHSKGAKQLPPAYLPPHPRLSKHCLQCHRKGMGRCEAQIGEAWGGGASQQHAGGMSRVSTVAPGAGGTHHHHQYLHFTHGPCCPFRRNETKSHSRGAPGLTWAGLEEKPSSHRHGDLRWFEATERRDPTSCGSASAAGCYRPTDKGKGGEKPAPAHQGVPLLP